MQQLSTYRIIASISSHYCWKLSYKNTCYGLNSKAYKSPLHVRSSAGRWMEKQMDYTTAHMYASAEYLRGQYWLWWHAAAVLLQADLSSFHMCCQLPHLFASWLENLICLSGNTWPREREKGNERDCQVWGREGGKDWINERVLLSENWMCTFLFRRDTVTSSNTLSIFFMFFYSFPHSLTPRPTLLLLWDVLLISQAPSIQQLCVLPPCGSDITTTCSAFSELH